MATEARALSSNEEYALRLLRNRGSMDLLQLRIEHVREFSLNTLIRRGYIERKGVTYRVI